MYNIVSNIQQSVYVFFDGVILFLVKCCCLITHHAMKGNGSVGITSCIFNSALDTGEWWAGHSSFCIPREKFPYCVWRGIPVCWDCATIRKVADSIPDGSLEFLIDSILPAAPWPWDRLRNEYQGYLLGVKVANLATLMCQLSWNLGASAPWNPKGLSRPV
jgi:hypothetical protein